MLEEIGRKWPKVLPFKRREIGTRHNELGESLSWDMYWKREKKLQIFRG